jgi:hypothetical protein
MNEFQANVDRWRDFFTLTGAAAANIIGVLFVSISLRADLRKATDSTMVGHNFVVLLISLCFMVPDISHDTLGTSMLLTAAIPGWVFLRDGFRLLRDGDMTSKLLLWSFFVSVISIAITMFIGIAFILNDDTELEWFVTVMAMCLLIPTKNSWRIFLVEPSLA